MIFLSGCHRSGKSTLAKLYAEKREVAFVPSRAGELYKSMGFRVGQLLTPEERLDIQDGILTAHIEDLKAIKHGELFITDRSPLDFATYVLGELHNVAPATQKRALTYVERCFWEMNRHAPIVIIVQPGIPYIEEEGKPALDLLAQERFNAVLWGLCGDDRLETWCGFIPRHVIDLTERLEAVDKIARIWMKEMVKESSQAILT